MKKTKLALLHSIIALLLCVSMLVGTTFAWFTDAVHSGKNQIVAGNLDIELEYLVNGQWKPVRENTNVFDKNALWEPGHTEVVYLRISNLGSLALKYQLGVNIAEETIGINVNDQPFKLSQYIEFGAIEGVQTAYPNRDAARKAVTAGTKIAEGYAKVSTMEAGDDADYVALVVYMPESVGNEANYKTGTTPPQITLGITLLASQQTSENDSFGPDYDNDATFPVLKPGSVTVDITGKVANGALTEAVTMTNAEGNLSAVVPVGTKVTGNSLILSVSELSATGSNVTLKENEILRPLDVHIQGVAADNTVPAVITVKEAMMKGLNIGNYALYHVEGSATNEMTAGDLSAHNGFTYDPVTGDVVLAMATFSEVAMTADTTKAWEGKFDYSWYDADAKVLTIANADQLAAFGAIVGGMDGQTQDSFKDKTVKLIADINLGDKESENNPDIIFYPIGYYNSEGTYERTNTAITSGLRNFEGTFDGNGHTISNFYQNTWEMKGDHDWYSPEEQYYRDGMGLFGRVYGGTVKNLTVKNFSSDGEIATTGVIAAYADGATFENIAIFNCNPRVYNIGNGGIVGCVGWYAKEANLKTTFKNITVDNSNKISALWGSYDVACGGIVGQYYPTSGQTSAGTPKNAGIDFVNCHVSAQMDVYNDVCANYQYYAYRYTGMLIGSVRENETIDGHVYPKMDGITAEGCTVHFGTWNDYYYCEFEKNGHPSYSGPDDYKFSRIPHSEINFSDSNGNGIIDTEDEKNSVTGCKHTHTAAEDQQCVYLEFNNLVTGYGWGVTSKGVGDLDGVTILDREVGNSVKKFEGKVTELVNNKEYKLSDIFSLIENSGVELIPGALMVSVTNLDKDGNVTAKFERDVNKWESGTITFTGNGKVNITIQDYYFCTPTTIEVTVTDRQPEVKFDVVMNNGDFLHRVGNSGTVALDKLFKAKEGVTVGTVSVTVAAVDGTGASGTYSNNAIQFSGTGVVKVTITDNDYCIPTELYLEVVEAVNATGATNATENNVVLLNDASSSGFTVSNGYAFYGNGFTVTCSGKGSYLNHGGMTLGYATVQTGGVLDNVQIICDVYPEAFIYTEEVKVSSNLDTEASTADKSRYMYQLSAIAVSGDGSVVANCYAYGGRNNIFVGGGDVTIENTVTECGTLSNIQIMGSSDDTVVIKDTTTIQYKTTSKYDSTKVMLGFGIVVGNNESASNPNIILQGDLKQYNWVTSDDTDVSNTYANTAINAALGVQSYKHTINDKVAVNMGIAYLNTRTTTFPSENDQRTNKQMIPYVMNSITMQGQTGYVYSISGSTINGSNVIDGIKRCNAEVDGVTPYVPNAQRDIPPKPVFSLGNQAVEGEDRYLKGDINGITARYENGQNAFTLDITKLMTASKYGSACTVNAICIDPDGNTLNGTVTLNKAGTYTLKFTILDTVFYSLTGVPIVKSMEYTHTVSIKLTIAEPSVPDATLTVNTSKSYTGKYTDSTADGSKKLSFNPLEAITVTDAGTEFTLIANVKSVDISYSATGTDGNGNAFGGTTTITVTYNEGQVLKIILAKPTSNSPGNPKSITYDSSTGTVKSSNTLAKNSCTAATWAVSSYSFTGKNGKTVTSNGVTFSIAADTSGGGCISGDTLITLADGTQKEIQYVTYEDQLLVWDFYKGEYTTAPVGAIVNHGYDEVTQVTVRFADGSEVKVLEGHGFFNIVENRFVILDECNVSDYIGHEFIKYDADGNCTITKLVGYDVETIYTEVWTIVSAVHFNCFLNGMLTLSPTDFADSPAYLMPFEIGEGMKYDEEQMQADIEKYGQYTYEDFADYCTYEQFVGFNFANWKVAVGKGYITFEDIIYLIKTYVNP